MKQLIRGIPAAQGFTQGPIFIWQDVDLIMPEPYPCSNPIQAWKKIQAAIESASVEIEQLRSKVLLDAGKEQAAIFDAHLMMANDEALHEMVKGLLEEGINPEAAWMNSINTFAEMLESLSDELLKARSVDVRDVGKRVLACLLGKSLIVNALKEKSVIVARDLAPSQTATIDRSLALAFCIAEGGPTSHTAILAKALGIPAIVGLGEDILKLKPGEIVWVDANAGNVIVQPEEDEQRAFFQRRSSADRQQAADLETAFEPARTLDGFQVEVVANIGGVEDAKTALAHGADGVGLFRTEFIYLNRQSMPTFEMQVDIYRQVVTVMDGRPLVVRTLDIGGDKQVDYLGIIQEPNPFLGWRGIRMISEKPEILRNQFCALLKAGQGSDLRIMLPMVSQLEEVIQARQLSNEALDWVKSEIPGWTARLQYGIMVEVPSAALMIEHFAPLVDFFSIGTNDLTQYTLAVDRMNGRVSGLASPFHPAVLKLIERTVRVAHQHNKWVGMCGELAGEISAVPFLLGIGLDEFSMSAAAIPAVKRVIRQIKTADCIPIAAWALNLSSAAEVCAYLQSELKRLTTNI